MSKGRQSSRSARFRMVEDAVDDAVGPCISTLPRLETTILRDLRLVTSGLAEMEVWLRIFCADLLEE